jgi:hypothetical protein
MVALLIVLLSLGLRCPVLAAFASLLALFSIQLKPAAWIKPLGLRKSLFSGFRRVSGTESMTYFKFRTARYPASR